MLSDAQRENIAATFDALDATADGLLTRDDAVLRADQLCTGLGLDAASQAHGDLHSAYQQCWDELMRFADATTTVRSRTRSSPTPSIAGCSRIHSSSTAPCSSSRTPASARWTSTVTV